MHSHTFMSVNRNSLLWSEREILPLALRGDYEKVRELLLILSCAIRDGAPLTPQLAKFLAGALGAIADGGNPNDAFCIKRKRGGRDTKAAAKKSIDRVFKIKALRHQNRKLSLEKAIAQIAEETETPEYTVQAAWRDYRDCVELDENGSVAFFDLGKKK
jgi:hypothetical protein